MQMPKIQLNTLTSVIFVIRYESVQSCMTLMSISEVILKNVILHGVAKSCDPLENPVRTSGSP